MLAAAVLGSLGASMSSAGVAWTNPSGTNSSVSWSMGQSDNGLFGSPVVSGGSFQFFPSNFKAASQNGAADQTSDRLSFRLAAAPGQTLQQIVITELGDFSINGIGNVNAFGTLYVTKLDNPGFGLVVADPLLVSYKDANGNPVAPVNLVPAVTNGNWNGTFTANLPVGTTEVMIVLNNILSTTTGPNSTALIQKKVVGSEVQIDVVLPEPASMSLIALGAGGFLLKRRARRTA